MKKKLTVTGKCIACGLCIGCEYLSENMDGTMEIKGGGIVDEKDEGEVNKIIELCPEKILALQSVKSKTKTQIEDDIKKVVDGFKLEVPDKKIFAFDPQKAYIGLQAGIPGEGRWIYSSESKARSAAKSEIDRCWYSKRDSVIKNVINDYRSEKLSPYYDYKEIDSNFYFNANQKAQKVLDKILENIQLLDDSIKIPNSLATIDTRPDRKSAWLDGIGEYLLYASGPIIAELDDPSLYGLNSYIDYVDIDEMETYETGRRGKLKEVYKYCYMGAYQARDEMESDLRSALKWGFDEKVIERAYESIKGLVREYESRLKQDLQNKVRELKQLIN